MDEEDKKLEKARRVAETTMKASKATIAKQEADLPASETADAIEAK